MYASTTAPVDNLPSRLPRATFGAFTEQYPGHFGDATRRVAAALATIRDPGGMTLVSEFWPEAAAMLRAAGSERGCIHG